ncbi:unnamed protein product [Linum trigynum]|uniref:Uncharacterized protein n=1 Tax=Linum trigynum TaxID=586398 RepID=A0AAV2E1G2_9ROSI
MRASSKLPTIVEASSSSPRVASQASPDVESAMKELALAPTPSRTSSPVATDPTVPSIPPPSKMNSVPLQDLAKSVEAKEEDALDSYDEAVASAAVVQEKQTITAPVSTHHVVRQRYEEKLQTHVVVERPKATPSFSVSGVEGRLGGTCPDVSKQFTLPNFDRVNWKYRKR